MFRLTLNALDGRDERRRRPPVSEHLTAFWRLYLHVEYSKNYAQTKPTGRIFQPE